MQETINSILDEVRRSWRYRWPGLFIAALAAAVATFGVLMLPDAFTSITELSVVRTGDDTPQQIHDAETNLLTDPNLNAAIRSARGGPGASDLGLRQQADAIIKNQIKVDGIDTTLFTISCRGSTPLRAKELCGLALKVFEGAVAKADAALASLSQELRDQEKALSAAEERLENFRASHTDVFGQGGISDRLATARSALDKAQADYSSASDLRDRLLRIWRNQDADSQVLAAAYQPPSDDALIQSLYTSFNTLQDLRSRFSENHPDVIEVERAIHAIFQQYPPGASMCALGDTDVLDDQPAVSSTQEITRLSINLAAANIWVCRSRSAIVQSQNDVSKLLALSQTARPAQAQLDQLTAEHDAIKDRVNNIQKQLENSSPEPGAKAYSIITPPTLPARASGPNRRLLLAGVLAGAVAAGSLFAYFLGLLANTFVRPAEVMRTFRLPFYGAVSQVSDIRARLDRSAEIFSFLLVVGVLSAVMLLLILFDPFISSARQWIGDAAGSILSGHSR